VCGSFWRVDKIQNGPIPMFVAYLVPLDVDVTGNITAKLCEVWSELNIFCTWVIMATAAILNLFNPQKQPHNSGYSFLSSNFMKHRRNIHRSVWKLLAC
jgi:hypothetical protein